MFEVAELGQKISKDDYEKEEQRLRDSLLAHQQRLKASSTSLIILVGGVDGAGKGETVNMLMEWLDPRGIEVHALGGLSDEERERPPFWQFWRRLPRRGQISIMLGSWYTMPIVDRVLGQLSGEVLEHQVQEILNFEQMLARDDVVLVKFWMHLSRKAQKKRLRSLAAHKETAWRVTKEDWRRFKIYDHFKEVSEDVLRKTVTGHAPWHIVEAADRRYQFVAVARTIEKALKAKLGDDQVIPSAPRAQVPPVPDGKRSLLSSLDYSQIVDPDEYKESFEGMAGRLNKVARRFSQRKRSAVVVFEGVDAAGKGGAIRRLAAAMDARNYNIIPVAAPTEEERAHPYMWRFWNRIPRAGRICIFDRSWYGRVLVEPAEGFCSQEEWQRAYGEINDFEDHLTRHGILVVKFWLAITQEEQLRRFREREQISFKQFKITPDDWRNREKWNVYESLIDDMVERTSTSIAPWTLVEANDKHFARLKVMRILTERLEAQL